MGKPARATRHPFDKRALLVSPSPIRLILSSFPHIPFHVLHDRPRTAISTPLLTTTPWPPRRTLSKHSSYYPAKAGVWYCHCLQGDAAQEEADEKAQTRNSSGPLSTLLASPLKAPQPVSCLDLLVASVLLPSKGRSWRTRASAWAKA